MQDGARCHTASAVMAEFHARGIFPVEWPPYSPDLNPIEALWDDMKDYIEDYYPDYHTKGKFREAVQLAWEAIGQSRLDELLDEMPARCQAVITAEGYHTKY